MQPTKKKHIHDILLSKRAEKQTYGPSLYRWFSPQQQYGIWWEQKNDSQWYKQEHNVLNWRTGGLIIINLQCTCISWRKKMCAHPRTMHMCQSVDGIACPGTNAIDAFTQNVPNLWIHALFAQSEWKKPHNCQSSSSWIIITIHRFFVVVWHSVVHRCGDKTKNRCSVRAMNRLLKMQHKLMIFKRWTPQKLQLVL